MLNYEFARQFDWVREDAPNKGLFVEAIQRWSGGQPGDSWCCEFVCFIEDITSKHTSPITRMQAVQQVYNLAKQKGWVIANDQRQPGDLFIYVLTDGSDHAHHIGFVTTFTDGIAGNTSADGKSSNGDGVHEHAIDYGSPAVKIIRPAA